MAPLVAVLEIPAAFLFVLRLAAGVGAAMVGWLIVDPVFRIVYRVLVRRATPAWLAPWARLTGATAIGLAVFYFLPIGGGPGWGWNTGGTGRTGHENGDGQTASNKERDKEKDAVEKTKKESAATDTREAVEIELIAAKRYKKDNKYYLLQRAEPPLSLEEVERLFKEKKERWKIDIIETPDSVGEGLGALDALRKLADSYRIPTTVNRVK